ncbi:hypothetical protein NY78_3227 [Desulfovibrio sp. TomC]|nr:hypothetical protein NY78_3227 [Desulfovibrio sp. TomC]
MAGETVQHLDFNGRAEVGVGIGSRGDRSNCGRGDRRSGRAGRGRKSGHARGRRLAVWRWRCAKGGLGLAGVVGLPGRGLGRDCSRPAQDEEAALVVDRFQLLAGGDDHGVEFPGHILVAAGALDELAAPVEDKPGAGEVKQHILGLPGAHRQVRGLPGAHEGPEIGPGGSGKVAHRVGRKNAQGKTVVIQPLGQGAPVERVLRHHRHGPVLGDRVQNFGQDGGIPGAWLIGGTGKGEVVGGPEQPRHRRRGQQHMGHDQPAEQGKDHPAGAGPGLPGQDAHRAEHLAKGEKEHAGRAGSVVVGPAVIARIGGEQGQAQAGDGRQQELWPHQREEEQGAEQEQQVFPFAGNTENLGQDFSGLGEDGGQGCPGAAAEPGIGPALGSQAVVDRAKGNDQGGCHVEIEAAEDDQAQAGPGPALAQPQVQAAKDRGQGIGFLDQGRGQSEGHGQDNASRGGGGQEAEQDRDEQMVEVEIEQGVGPDREIQGIGQGGQHAVAASGQKRRQGQDQGLGG